MDTLAFLAKTIGATARIGAAVALGALLVAILRGMNVEPLAGIDKSTYAAIATAGIIGACAVVVEFIIALGSIVKQVGIPLLAAKIKKRRNRKWAIKNMQTPSPEFVATLRYLKAHNLKRFPAPAPWRNKILQRMEQSFLIEIDDPKYHLSPSDTYYWVPDYVWDRIERPKPAYPTEPLSERPPWLFPHRTAGRTFSWRTVA